MKYVCRRLLQLIPILLGITFLSFAMMHVAGSDVVTQLYTNRGVEVHRNHRCQRAELGLDKPFLTQYFTWLKGMLTGDMGISYVTGRNVLDTFMEKLPATLLLTVLSILLTVLISIPLGILAAIKQGKWMDHLLRISSFIGNAQPNFFVAILLMELLSIKLGWLPVIASDVSFQSAIMPTLTLAISMSAKYMRQVRATVLEELNKDYVIGLKARGVRSRDILWKNVMRSSWLRY